MPANPGPLTALELLQARVSLAFSMSDPGGRGTQWVHIASKLDTGEVFSVNVRRQGEFYLFSGAQLRARWGVVPCPDFPESLPSAARLPMEVPTRG